MLEEFAWEFFVKTGDINSYLLYRESQSQKENSGAYGCDQNQWSGDSADQGERQ